jgi:hypothetical protein
MQIYVKMLTGQTLIIETEPSHTVLSVKHSVHDQIGIPVDQQRLLFTRDGVTKQLEDDRDLSMYDIQHRMSLHLVLRLRGMISTWKQEDDPLAAYLNLTCEERSTAPVPLDELREAAADKGASPSAHYSFDKRCSILAPCHLEQMRYFLNHVQSARGRPMDLRMNVPGDLLARVLEVCDSRFQPGSRFQSENVVQELLGLHRLITGAGPSAKIAMRSTIGPTNGCINFHCDGYYATGTTQILLSSPLHFKGGRIMFFHDDKIHAPTCEYLNEGSITQHSRNVLHGVTALTEGTRQSLFVLDTSNGLGEVAVFTVGPEMVAEFLSSQSSSPTPEKMCCVCMAYPRQYAMLPCGHHYFCSACVAECKTCPVCKTVKKDIVRVYI